MAKTLSAGIQPEALLKQLSRLWTDMAKESAESNSRGVLRACAMTLLALVDDYGDAAVVDETLAELMRTHPNRGIVVRRKAGQHPPLDARVVAQCWMPFGRREQVCCEQVQIFSDEANLRDVPAVVLPLIVADLPVILWCRSQQLIDDPSIYGFLDLARKAIFDSSGARGVEMLPRLAALQASGRRIADLAWTRLTPWRELVAQVFENPLYRSRLHEVRRVEIRSCAGEHSSAVRYFESWLRQGLAAGGSAPEIEIAACEGPLNGELRGLVMYGPSWTAEALLSDANAVEIRLGALENRFVLPQPQEHDLMREELSVAGHDAVFQQCLQAVTRR